MDRKSWERGHSDIALYQTNQQRITKIGAVSGESVADQTQRENSRLFRELSTKNRNITQEIVKKNKNYEEFSVSKRIESNN